MGRGRIPFPKAINDLKGDPGKRRRHQKEPPAPPNRPEIPEYLSADPIAAAEWQHVCDQLDLMGLLSSADRATIELYCVSYSRFRKAHEMIAKYGEVMVSKKTGAMYLSPYASVLSGSMDTCKRLLIEMGMTPAARSRLRFDAAKDEPGDFEQFILKVG